MIENGNDGKRSFSIDVEMTVADDSRGDDA